PADFKALYTPEFADQVWVKSYRGGKWSEPIAITGPRESIARCAVAVEGDGTVWAIYSALRKGNHDLYARSIRPGKGQGQLGKEQRLTNNLGSDVTPVACTTQDGVRVVYQRWLPTGAVIGLQSCVRGTWLAGLREKGVQVPKWVFTSNAAAS